MFLLLILKPIVVAGKKRTQARQTFLEALSLIRKDTSRPKFLRNFYKLKELKLDELHQKYLALELTQTRAVVEQRAFLHGRTLPS